MKKVLIIGLALIFVMPVGIGIFGGGTPRPTANRLASGEDRSALVRELAEGIEKHCASRQQGSAKRAACVKRQAADLNATIGLLRHHASKPAGEAIEACLAKFVPAIDATADWTRARACVKKGTGL